MTFATRTPVILAWTMVALAAVLAVGAPMFGLVFAIAAVLITHVCGVRSARTAALVVVVIAVAVLAFAAGGGSSGGLIDG